MGYFGGRPFQAECTQTHSDGVVSLTFTIMKQSITFAETQKTKTPKSNQSQNAVYWRTGALLPQRNASVN